MLLQLDICIFVLIVLDSMKIEDLFHSTNDNEKLLEKGVYSRNNNKLQIFTYSIA